MRLVGGRLVVSPDVLAPQRRRDRSGPAPGLIAGMTCGRRTEPATRAPSAHPATTHDSTATPVAHRLRRPMMRLSTNTAESYAPLAQGSTSPRLIA